MADVGSWASLRTARTAFVVAGVTFVFVSLATACLDYAGEELFDQCDTPAAPLPGSGSGSGAIVDAGAPGADQPDCGAPTHAPGSGSGSGS
ncbi:hypothetical protein WME76_19880 [Sorangium sp. So ce119]|uniref:hypothetical protein n=1 Tax=Sorangium TaxID=39643 RepID=UPI00077905D3|nr:hypothetical protein BE11_25355 [Sorangium cellulosum]